LELDVIAEFADKLDWARAPLYQSLTAEQLLEYSGRIRAARAVIGAD
jgi:hypothetical protein